MFTQRIENGCQVEHPDNWLRYGNPWEFPRPEVLYPVKFGGRVVEYKDEHGQLRHHWVDTEDVMAMAYDTPVPGYRHGHGEQHAAVVGQGVARLQPQVLQRGQLHPGGRGEERVGEPLEGALPRRHDHHGPGAAAQAAVLLRLRLAPGHPPPLHQVPSEPRRAAGRGRHPAERHPSLHRHSRADAHPGR